MDGQALVDTLRESRATELTRLGAEKALVAATDARLETPKVLTAAAIAELRACETFRAWADDNGPVAAAFDEIATMERAHYEAIIEQRGAAPDTPDTDDLHTYLRRLDDDIERIGAGLVGRSLATERTLLQFVNFFVNEGNPATADLFRGLREDTQALVDRGADLLDEHCETSAEYERALQAAERAVDLAYEAYETSLTSMGVDPKPVC